jgi:hypothetical protein
MSYDRNGKPPYGRNRGMVSSAGGAPPLSIPERFILLDADTKVMLGLFASHAEATQEKAQRGKKGIRCTIRKRY